MKVKVVSDLHLEFCEHGHGVSDLGSGDILILGGDILCVRHLKTNGRLREVYNTFLYKCVENFDRVLFIAGNHEFYGYNYEGTLNLLKTHLNPHVDFLHDSYVVINDWIFVGSTFWTDFRNGNSLDMMESQNYMNDYKTIRIGSNYRKLTSNDTYQFHINSKNFLEKTLEEYKDKNVWVLTHHGPSYQSVHEKYRTDRFNSSYVSDLDDFILSYPQIRVWSHAHVHDTFNYKIGDCRIVCNPRGYFDSHNMKNQNSNFDPNFEVEI